jgi:transposase
MQARTSTDNTTAGPFDLQTRRLGPLPLINHFLQCIGIEQLLDRHVPTHDRRITLSHAKALGVLLRSLIVEREPVYRQQETVEAFHPRAFGLSHDQLHLVGDDRIGRALDELFEADRAALLTEIVISAANQFGLSLDRLHNDSTSVRFCGQYRMGRERRGAQSRIPWITHGYSKDHRPDLKQLVLCLTTTRDGAVPVQFRCLDGNANDVDTHIESWEALRRLAGRPDFLYVADSKLCSRENMDHIDRNGGRFVTVMPRSRMEDSEFRKWIQTHEPQWQKVWDRPNPQRKGGPRDRWFVFVAPLPSREAWPVVWVYSALLALRQEQTRREHIAAATQKLSDLQTTLRATKSRIRKAQEVDERVDKILRRHKVTRYVKVQRRLHRDHTYRQLRRGRPGPDTAYRRITHRRWDILWQLDTEAIEYDRKSDGMYPLLTNDRTLAPSAVLEAHKGQPSIEKRFEQIKTVHEIAPVFLKKPQRIEALFTLYFIGMLAQAILERQLRLAMAREEIEELPLYPEERRCARPTTEQILRLFSHIQMQVLRKSGKRIQVFHTKLTELQNQLLRLLGVPKEVYLPQD